MSFLGNIGAVLGIGSDGQGLDYHAANAQIDKAVSPDQADAALTQANGGIDQQKQFLAALQNQGGLGNQASVFAQQQALSNQLGQMAQGQGPNPAQAALAQATGNNIASQNALMAGQRGAGANAGLIARQAAQQGAATQQQSVGQAATLQAQQQIAAANALASQQAQMAQLANTQVGQQQGAINAYTQAGQNLYGTQLGAIANQNNAAVSSQNNVNSANAEIQKELAKSQIDTSRGILGGIAPISMLTKGIGVFADGGMVSSSVKQEPAVAHGSPRSRYGKACKGMPMNTGAMVPGKAPIQGDSLKNDKVPAMLSPGEIVIPRSIVQSKDPASAAAKFVSAVLAKQGMKR